MPGSTFAPVVALAVRHSCNSLAFCVLFLFPIFWLVVGVQIRNSTTSTRKHWWTEPLVLLFTTGSPLQICRHHVGCNNDYVLLKLSNSFLLIYMGIISFYVFDGGICDNKIGYVCMNFGFSKFTKSKLNFLFIYTYICLFAR